MIQGRRPSIGPTTTTQNRGTTAAATAVRRTSSALRRTSARARGRGKSNTADFNPRLIFSQIVAIQCFHYLFLGVLFQVNHVLFDTTVSIDRIFTGKYLNLWSFKGWVDNAAILLGFLVGSVLLAVIVEKSKKCLDFAITLFIIHLISCCWYDGLPSSWDWWILHILGTIVMILLGEYLCSLKELSDIPLLEL